MNTIIGSELYVLSSKGALHIACIGGKLERHQPLVQVWTSCCATFTHVPCRLAVWHMQMCPGKLQVRSYALLPYTQSQPHLHVWVVASPNGTHAGGLVACVGLHKTKRRCLNLLEAMQVQDECQGNKGCSQQHIYKLMIARQHQAP